MNHDINPNFIKFVSQKLNRWYVWFAYVARVSLFWEINMIHRKEWESWSFDLEKGKNRKIKVKIVTFTSIILKIIVRELANFWQLFKGKMNWVFIYFEAENIICIVKVGIE